MISERQLSTDIQWHITASCINRCKHCYTYGVGSTESIPEKDLSLDQLFHILTNIKNFENKYHLKFPMFAITGGDPLISPNGWRLIEELRQENRQVSILGIPERVTPENISKMKELGIMFYQVSLDGLEDTHDAIRGLGSFKRTIEAVKLLDKSGLDYRIMYTIHNLNQDELIPLIDYLDSLNIFGNFTFDFMIGSPEQLNPDSPRMLNSSEAEQVIKLFHNKSVEIIKKGRKLQLFHKTGMNKVLNLMEQNFQEGDELLFSGCSAGNHLSILADGTVYPCRRLPIAIGNLLEDSLEEIYLNNPLMQKFRRREYWEDCKNCKYFNMCMGCPAVSYAFTGDPFKKMEYCFLKAVDDNYLSRPSSLQTTPVDELNFLRDKQEENHIAEKNIQDLWHGLKIMPRVTKNFINDTHK